MTQLQKMTEQVIEIFNAYGAQGTKDWDYDIAAHDLQYQIGKLTKGILQLKEYRYAEGLTREQIKNNIADECADILTEVLFVAHKLDIDIEKAFEAMLESDKRKISERTK